MRTQELKGSVNFVYVSQVTYKTQETLIHDLAEFGNEMEEALLGSTEDRNAGSTGQLSLGLSMLSRLCKL